MRVVFFRHLRVICMDIMDIDLNIMDIKRLFSPSIELKRY